MKQNIIIIRGPIAFFIAIMNLHTITYIVSIFGTSFPIIISALSTRLVFLKIFTLIHSKRYILHCDTVHVNLCAQLKQNYHETMFVLGNVF